MRGSNKRKYFRILSSLFVLLVLSFSLVITPFQVYAIDPDPIDIALTDPLAKVNATYARGDSWIIKAFENKTFKWSSAPQRVYNGMAYAPYIYQDNYTSDGFYQVQSGLIGARIYDYYTEFYSPDMSEVRLYDERWEVQIWTGSKWSDVGAQSGTPTYVVSQGENEINITKTFTSWAGILEIKYVFREGQPLKHVIIFTSDIVEETQFRVIQKWAGIVADRVKHNNGEDIITEPTVLNSSSFKFLKEDGSLSLFENQWDMYYGYNETTGEYYVLANKNIKPVEIDIHAQGLKADFVFSNWTLIQGQSLEIDPDTASYNNPIEDGWVYFFDPAYSQTDDAETLYIGVNNVGIEDDMIYRIYFEWNISSIADSSSIIDTEFKYEGEVNYPQDCHVHKITNQPSETGVPSTIWLDCADGTVYVDPEGFPVVGGNRVIDLGTDADSDLEDALSVDWFAIGVQADSEALGLDHLSQIASEEHDAVPDPTLNVEYSLGNDPTVDSFSTEAIIYAGEYDLFNLTIEDADGIADFKSVNLTLEDGIVLTWINATHTYSESADPSSYCTVQNATSFLTEINATYVKLSFNVSLTSDYQHGLSNASATVWDTADESGSDTVVDWFTFGASYVDSIFSEVGMISSISRVGTYLGSISSDFSMEGLASRMVLFVRTVSFDLSIESSISRMVYYGKVISQNVQLTMSIIIKNIRKLGLVNTITSEVSRILFANRNTQVIISFVDSIDRTIFMKWRKSETVVMALEMGRRYTSSTLYGSTLGTSGSGAGGGFPTVEMEPEEEEALELVPDGIDLPLGIAGLVTSEAVVSRTSAIIFAIVLGVVLFGSAQEFDLKLVDDLWKQISSL